MLGKKKRKKGDLSHICHKQLFSLHWPADFLQMRTAFLKASCSLLVPVQQDMAHTHDGVGISWSSLEEKPGAIFNLLTMSELASDFEVLGSKEWYVMCWVWRKRVLYVWGKWDTWLTMPRTNETMFTHPKLPFVCNQMVFPQSRSMNWSGIMVVRSPCWKVLVILFIINSNKIETNENGFCDLQHWLKSD